MYTKAQIASKIDYAVLKPPVLRVDICHAVAEVLAHGCASLCVPGSFVPLVHDMLGGNTVKVCSVVGFPHGDGGFIKSVETQRAIFDGAQEIDFVINYSKLLSGDVDYVNEEVVSVVEWAKRSNAQTIVKAILEICYLNEQSLRIACDICKDAGVDILKTSTGFGSGGATLGAVQIMREYLPVKASGGIKTLEQAVTFLDAGCVRLGCGKLDWLKDAPD